MRAFSVSIQRSNLLWSFLNRSRRP